MTLGTALLFSVFLVSPAWADGGKGGAGYGGTGGTTSATGAGGDGGYGGSSYGGGGGGAGATGGAGGSGGSRFGGDPGGAGGASPGASGSPGSTNPPYSSATGGGGGGAHGGIDAGLPANAVSGGNGGDGAIGYVNVGGGGGGGAGGWGWVVTGGGDLGTLGVAVTGGNGGGGANVPGFGGNGGDGGIGLYFDTADVTAIINAAVTGGNAGAAGIGYSIGGSAGAGGAGVVGSDLTLTIAGAGSVTGGSGGGNAITFAGGANTLALQSGAALSGNIAINSGGTLNIVPAVGYTLSSGITGDGSVTKTGTQALVLTGASNYTGATTVSAGTLLVDGSISSSSLVTVNSGAKLGGIGSVGIGVTVASGGIVHPGDAAGDFATLNTGALGISGTAEFDVGASQVDRIVSSGAVNLSGATLTLNLLAAPVWATQFTLISTTGALNGTFTGLPDGMLFNVNGSDFVIHYSATTVTITAGTPPAVTSLLPASGAQAGGMNVAIMGSNFTGATAVTFGGAAATSFVVNSATQITATAPAGTGTVDVTVTTPIGTSAASAADQYSYFVPSLVVNSLADGLPAMPINCAVGNAGTCRLRDAVAAAAGGDTVTFAVDGTITLTGNATLTLAQSMTIDASGHTIAVDGNQAASVFTVNAGVVVAIDRLTILHGNGGYLGGGGVYSSGTLTMTDCSVSNNTTANGAGGGIYSDGDALTLIRVTVSNNQAGGGGGEGGGIYSDSATLVVSDSLVSGNSAIHDSGGIYIVGGSARVTGTTVSDNTTFNGAGAGIYNAGTLVAINSTLAGNAAGGGSGNGGGIYNSGGPYDSAVGAATLINVTVAGNASRQGGVEIYNWGTFALTNSIVDRTAAADIACGNGGAHALTDNGGNLDSDGTCGFSAANNSKPNAALDLGALASVNGSIPVMLPAPDSDAIDFGLDSACSDATIVAGVDELGAVRPMGAHCDAGAVEVTQYKLTVNVSGNGNVASTTSAVPATSDGIAACTSSGGVCSAYYWPGMQVTLALAADAGWHLASVIVADGSCAGGLAAGISPYTTAALADDCTLSVVFASDQVPQTITFPDPGVQTLTDGTFAISASTDSGLQVVFAATSSACSIGSPSFVTPTTTATVTMLAAGTCSITASQGGDANHQAATPVTRDVTIAKKSTTLALSGPGSAAQGQTLTLVATVQGDPPSGTVLFCDSTLAGNICTGTALCAPDVALVAGASSSTATCTTSLATSGTHSITAYYGGDAVFLPVAAATPLVVVVSVGPATTSVVSAPVLDRWLLLTLATLMVVGAVVQRRCRRTD